MNCQECEGLLASEESSGELDRHLTECAECRELAATVRANADAFREMTTVELPSVRGAVLTKVRAQDARKRVLRWGWALAAAAAVVIGFFATRPARVEPLPPVVTGKALAHPVVKRSVAAAPKSPRRLESRRQAKSLAPQESLKIKMFTSDPDVVIYWLVEPKEGSE